MGKVPILLVTQRCQKGSVLCEGRGERGENHGFFQNTGKYSVVTNSPGYLLRQEEARTLEWIPLYQRILTAIAHHFMAKRWGNNANSDRLYSHGLRNHWRWVTAAMKIKDPCSWKKSYDQPRQHIKMQRHYFASKGPSSQSYGLCKWDVRARP